MEAQEADAKIIKRDGRRVDFDDSKIFNAIKKAGESVDAHDPKLARRLTDVVASRVAENFKGTNVPTVEDVQNIVEEILIEAGLSDIARSYILYRRWRTELRDAKGAIGVADDLKLSVNAARVLKKRYLLKDEEGKTCETPKQLFRRVAKAIAAADIVFNKNADIASSEEAFYRLLLELEFLPNSPTLMNAGTSIGQLSACFVLPVEDSVSGIFSTLKEMAIIHKSGGGTGFSFSKLRPAGDVVQSTSGIASGPVSFMRVFDVATEVIKQGGRRRGANMGILKVDHPDIEHFIMAKEDEGFFPNFNVSVAVTDAWMEQVKKGGTYDLINPRSGEIAGKRGARDVFEMIVTMAWRTGDPGIIFLDRINAVNPTPKLGPIESTNPCGEQPLLANESCNLGSINLARMTKSGEVDWPRLKRTVATSVHFLDNIIEVNTFPTQAIAEITLANRKIGLGVMGLAEFFINLGIPYDSDEALAKAEELMNFVQREARAASARLAEERGSFPHFEESRWRQSGWKRMRNATLTTVAPTGTISIIAGTTSGIEPLFALSFVRDVMEGTRLTEVNESFVRAAKSGGFYSEELIKKITGCPSIQMCAEIPESVRDVFKTAFDVAPEWHVRMQAAFQKYVDNGVSKTVNLPAEASIEDVRGVYQLAYELGCKGVTVYRYGSKKEQVLYTTNSAKKTKNERFVIADSEFAGGCPSVDCPY